MITPAQARAIAEHRDDREHRDERYLERRIDDWITVAALVDHWPVHVNYADDEISPEVVLRVVARYREAGWRTELDQDRRVIRIHNCQI